MLDKRNIISLPLNSEKAEIIKDNTSNISSLEQESEVEYTNHEVKAISEETEEAKEAILEQARKKAANIIANAEKRAEHLAIEKAETLSQEMTDDIREQYKLAANFIKNLQSENQSIIDELNKNINKLLIIALHQILGEKEAKKFYSHTIQNIIKKYANIASLTIRINETDYQGIESFLFQDDTLSSLSEVKVRHDSSLKQGTCLIETNSGDFILSMDQYIKEVFKKIGL